MTDALTGTVRQVSLRSGNTYTGNRAPEFVQRYLSTSLSAQHQTIILRGDSSFATPNLMETLEGNNIFYTIRLKSNPRLKRMALDGRYVNLDNLLMIEGQLTTDEFEYQAASWDKARRVIVLNDEHGGTQFIVTNLSLPQKTSSVFTASVRRLNILFASLKVDLPLAKLIAVHFYPTKRTCGSQ